MAPNIGKNSLQHICVMVLSFCIQRSGRAKVPAAKKFLREVSLITSRQKGASAEMRLTLRRVGRTG